MIGKKVEFIESVMRSDDRGVKQNKLFVGVVMDKFRAIDREGNPCDYYLVEIENGLLKNFFPTQANRIIHDTPIPIPPKQ